MNDSGPATTTNGHSASPGDLKEQALALGRDVKNQATNIAEQASQTLKTQAGQFVDTAKELASDAGEKLRATVQDQKAVGADYVGKIANIVRRTAQELDGEIPQAAHYIRKAATQIDSASQALRNRNVSELVGSVQDFARKQPTAFLGAAVLVGFAAVRFLKSSAATGGTTASPAPDRPSPVA